jgi:hypothetical protein
MIQGTKYVDAFPSQGGGRLLPNEQGEEYTLSSRLVHCRDMTNREISRFHRAGAGVFLKVILIVMAITAANFRVIARQCDGFPLLSAAAAGLNELP